MHYHHAWDGFYDGGWGEAKAAYRKIMREPSDVKLVTVMREPVGHYLSYYYYFLQPETGVGFLGTRLRSHAAIRIHFLRRAHTYGGGSFGFFFVFRLIATIGEHTFNKGPKRRRMFRFLFFKTQLLR